ncbi:hypothetical protein HID58_046840 [Brassica napus]|uniref:Uncharacterized protein n=1 Tax=Brassica napus TaxID=3708 RepID=A0ABQ8AXM8_BRANA|nr:hypothetical protein HID58_046840 [Brassica napus]
MERRELEQIKAKKGTDHYSFTARLDRHGKPFGERVSTRKTRAPPPTPITMNGNPPTQTWIHKTTKEGSHEYSSPQHTQNRQTKARETQRGRYLFPQRSQGQWRAKQMINPNGMCIPTMEEVMEDLHHVTRQYLSCPDPVEAAARRQRVLQGDSSGQMEETAVAIIAPETRRQALISQSMGDESNPNTPPPPIQNTLNQTLLLHAPSVTHNPKNREENNAEEGDSGLRPISRETESTPQRTIEGPAKLKSIVISPNVEQEEAPMMSQVPIEQLREEETLREFQNKVKRRVKRPLQARSTRNSPNILRGASSKKRRISQIQNSPARGVASPKRSNSASQKRANND